MELQVVLGDLVPGPRSELRHRSSGQSRIHVDRGTAIGADDMVVAIGVGVVAGTRPVAEREDPGLPIGDEQPERAVDGGWADAGLARPNPLENLGCCGVISGFAQYVEHRSTLRSKPEQSGPPIEMRLNLIEYHPVARTASRRG